MLVRALGWEMPSVENVVFSRLLPVVQLSAAVVSSWKISMEIIMAVLVLRTYVAGRPGFCENNW